jgi:RHS repeat-associated protein
MCPRKVPFVGQSGIRYLASDLPGACDGLLLVQERDGNNTPTVTYTRGRDLSGTLAGAGGIGGLLARSHGYSSGNWSYHNFYHADGNGNVTALVNGSGALQASYKYDPYGRWLSGGGTLASANVLRFSSKPWVGFAGSTTSGLYSYGYRFYDPYLQRWINRDPLGDSGTLRKLSLPYPYDDLLGSNGYVYCGNTPPNMYDKDGRIAPLILWSGMILWRKACGVTGLIVAKQKFPDYQDAKQHCYANRFATRCAGLLPPLDYFLIGLLWEIIDPSPDGIEDLWANLDGIVGAYKLTEFCEDHREQCPF